MELYYVHAKFEKTGKITGNSSRTPNGPVKIDIKPHSYRSNWWEIIDVDNNRRIDDLYIVGDKVKVIEYVINVGRAFPTKEEAISHWNSKLMQQLDRETKRFEGLTAQLKKKMM